VVDGRHSTPRFRREAIAANQAVVEPARKVAAQLGVTVPQVSLAWVLAQGGNVLAIPGTKTLRYLEENAGTADVVLPQETLDALTDLPAPVGTRY
jgi:aryl-alcohol dehydrogenase-like predicted oxidoreductase